MALKKSDILHGVTDPKEIYIEELGDTIWLRPLSVAEYDQLDAIEAEGMESYETNSKSRGRGKNLQGETIARGKINVLKATKNGAKARDKKIYMSLDNPKNADDPWSEEDVGKMLRGVADEIGEKIDEISGVNVTKGDIDKFPENE